MRFWCITLFVPPILLVGCASNNEMKRPLMFKEAKLPAGFPPPGPVGEIIVKKYPAYSLSGDSLPNIESFQQRSRAARWRWEMGDWV